MKDLTRDKYQHAVFDNHGEGLACILNAFFLRNLTFTSENS